MEWYEEMNFFSVQMVNKDYVNWWTKLSFEEAKQMIGNNAFVIISSERNEDAIEREYNTKAILAIKDYTEQERKRYKRQAEINEKKWQSLKKSARGNRLTFFTKKLKQLTVHITKKNLIGTNVIWV